MIPIDVKKSAVFILLQLFLVSSVAQQFPSEKKNITITGKVMDQDFNEPLEYATVAFFSIKQQKTVDGGITDVNGNFSIDIPIGMYIISVEFISFKTKKLEKQQLIDDTDLGTITLGLDAESLDDVLIVAEKTTVEIKLDKKIYNVGKDLTVRGGTVSDVLDNVPSVSVDVEGNVALRGNNNVRILINGKPSGLIGLNSTNALRQLPAASIERVEVITSPSARYDAEGTAGILNIILKRSKLKGLNGAVTINTGFPTTAGISGNLNYRSGDFNFFTTSGYEYRESPGHSNTETQYFNLLRDPENSNDFINNPDTFLNESNIFDRKSYGLTTNIGVEYYINETSSLIASFLYKDSDENNDTTNRIEELDINGNLLSINTRFDPEIEDDLSKQLSVNYTKEFTNKGEKLTADFQIENNKEDENSRIIQDNIILIELVGNDESEDKILLQSDYVLPIGENSQFEIGYRGNFSELNTKYLIQNDIKGDVTTNNDLSNNLIYKEHVNAAYTQYGSKKGNLSYLLGIRLESTRITIDQETSGDFDKKNYVNIFPTVNLGYEVSDKQSIILGYNRRIQRPRSRYINPFPSRSSATSLFQGNSDLDPSYSNQVDIGYLNRIGTLTLNSSVYYSHTTQVFTFIAEDTGETTFIGVDDTNLGTEVPVIRRTPINLASADRLGLEFTVTYNPSKKWRVNGNFNAFQNTTKGTFKDAIFDASIFSWFARINNKVTLPGNIDWQTSMLYRGPNEDAQTKTKSVFSMNLALSKDLFKERGSLTFNINDVFNSRKRQNVSTTTSFISKGEFQWRERSFNLAFTYRFNQKKDREQSTRESRNYEE